MPTAGSIVFVPCMTPDTLTGSSVHRRLADDSSGWRAGADRVGHGCGAAHTAPQWIGPKNQACRKIPAAGLRAPVVPPCYACCLARASLAVEH